MNSSVPKCAIKELAENGNIEHSPQLNNGLYKYDFTLNNYTDLEVCQVKETISSIAKKGGFGFEIGDECKTPHLQGYFSLIKRMRMTGLVKLPGFSRCSFRPVRNEPALIAYIQKDGNFWTHGFPKKIQILTDLYPWQKDAEALLTATNIDDRIVHWWHEETGNIGKSAFAKYMVVKHKALYCCSGKYADLINLVFNCNMDECNCIIFDIPRNQGNNVSYSAIESIKNGLICNTKFETGTKVFNSPHVLILSNLPPIMSSLSSDRWKIKYLGKKEESIKVINEILPEWTEMDDIEYSEMENEFCELK